MYLKCSVRRKNGKEHRSWSIVESRRLKGGGSVQRHVLYLGEINDSQRAGWEKTIEVVTREGTGPVPLRQMALFAEDRAPQSLPDADVVSVRMSQMGSTTKAVE